MIFSDIDIIELLFIIIPWIVMIFIWPRRSEKHDDNEILGDLFISDDGSMYSQFDISIPDIEHRKTITLKIHKV